MLVLGTVTRGLLPLRTATFTVGLPYLLSLVVKVDDGGSVVVTRLSVVLL